MSTRSSSFLERVIRAIARGSIPIDASQCDGPCVVKTPADATSAPRGDKTERQSPIRWLSLR